VYTRFCIISRVLFGGGRKGGFNLPIRINEIQLKYTLCQLLIYTTNKNCAGWRSARRKI
jgi:hypothetical protein